MIILLNLYIFLIFLGGLFSFISSWKHLLATLLRLEFIVLSLFFFFFFLLLMFNFELYFTIFFLTFRVCEGALGISILVSLIRTHGNDYFNSFSVLQC